MSLEQLLNEGLIEAFETTKDLVSQTLASSEKDLKTAVTVLEAGDYDWALTIAYHSMLQAGRALMFHFGYRPKGEHKHVAVVRFASEKLTTSESSTLVKLLNKTRKRRHAVLYEVRETVSRSEAERAIEMAKKLISTVKNEITKR